MILLPALDPSSIPALGHMLDRLGMAHRVLERPEDGSEPSGILLSSAMPFEQNAAWLRRMGWWREMPQYLSDGVPLLALDGAMHLLAEGSEEAPRENGLGFLPGWARRLGPGVKLPHLGWNRVRQCQPHELIPDPSDGWLYFQHLHALESDAATWWEGRHGRPFAVLSLRGRVMACQARLPQSGPLGRLMLQRLLRAQGLAPMDR